MLGSRSTGRGVAWGATTLAIGLVVGVTTPATAAPPEVPATGIPLAGKRIATPDATVTLLTGDRVSLVGGAVSVRPAAGREKAEFHRFERDGHLHVVPRDAYGALARGKLDPRLFDVTGLIDARYDDAHRDSVPLILQAASTGAAGVSVTHALPGALAAKASKSAAATAYAALVADPGVEKVWLDGLRQPTLDQSTRQIGAPAAWERGLTGKGVKVGVVDTGVDGAHPDLSGRELAQADFTEDNDNVDRVGHGTHVAATIASHDPKYRGVAPDAQILDAKVCVLSGCAESWIISGLTWVVEQGADVVNVSLGGPDGPETDPIEALVDSLSARTGTLFVVAAGNSGRPGTIGSPGSADSALTVGAVERDDDIAVFSSRGPRSDGGVKPDVTAPGVGIVAAKSAEGQIGDPVDATHVALSGTSMATPHVAGAAALLAQQHPDWTGSRIKAALTATAAYNPKLGAYDQGSGRIDLTKAVDSTLTSEPTGLAFGVQAWPHQDDKPVTKEVEYRNTGTTPISLRLTIDAAGPADLFSVSPKELTVPAGGTATATVTADTRGTADGGAFGGAVVATGGPTPVRTPVGVDSEVESYDVTFEVVDQDGSPATGHATDVFGLTNQTVKFLPGDKGTFTTRVPKGDYLVNSSVTDQGRTKGAFLVAPKVQVSGPTTVRIDARKAKPVRITPPDPAAKQGPGELTYRRTHGQYGLLMGVLFIGGYDGTIAIGHLGEAVPAAEFETVIGTTATSDRATYRLSYSDVGRLPDGFVRTPSIRDLAEVRTSLDAAPAGRTFLLGANPTTKNGTGGWGSLDPVPASGKPLDYVTPELRWGWRLEQNSAPDRSDASWSSPDRDYRKGRVYQQRFLRPPFGPAVPANRYLPSIARYQDLLLVSPSLLVDGEGNQGRTAGKGTVALYRDGKLLSKVEAPGVGQFPVPAGPAEYRVDIDLTTAADVLAYASRVTASWTFRSDTATGTTPVALPAGFVRFTPKLDDSGTLRGRSARVPFVVEFDKDSGAGKVRKVGVDVSYDDGKTWSPAPVTGDSVLLKPPAGSGYVSLRAKGSDSKGNRFEHAVVRTFKFAR
ncbi:S8 family serine peptidase [Saccharothrix violaceirubra]|uniref:Subtilisin family serine protease n=1 Tax=Saccharothrix violaceirubra TaxID=413306 RepID=A0A7W7T941_9PSEU|nr:S8 family serine peptidase [Saccharothrix violaceirubra]MBB4967560.1 subtilisin family serine protease [Saccharothrix violaceirubra]